MLMHFNTYEYKSMNCELCILDVFGGISTACLKHSPMEPTLLLFSLCLSMDSWIHSFSPLVGKHTEVSTLTLNMGGGGGWQ